MLSIRKSLIYFLIFTLVASSAAFVITQKAYTVAYEFDESGYVVVADAQTTHSQ